jgi:crotonobetainyl-CoA:carnitine CoA-transferase CaiB-like acyl-CoA transferase
VYPSLGDDRWVAIAVFDDDEWKSFVSAIGEPSWCLEPRFASQQLRFENQDALDGYVSSWTRTRDRHEVMELLQSAGVRAGAVQNAEDVNEHDPQMAHRGIFFELDHPAIGPARFEGVPVVASSFGPDNWRSAPLLGEDNAFVYGEILGLPEDEIAELTTTGVI